MRREPVTQVRFASQNVLASSSKDGSTKLWGLGTGQETAEAVPPGVTFSQQGRFAFCEQGSAEEQKVNGYVVAAKGSTLFIFQASDDSEEGAPASVRGAPVAFFQCASQIRAFEVAGASIAVGVADGQVLQLWAEVLQRQG